MMRPTLKAPSVAGGLLLALGLLASVCWIFQVESISRHIPGAGQMGIVSPMLFVLIGASFVSTTRAGRLRPIAQGLVVVASAVLIIVPLAYLLESFAGVNLGMDFVRAGTVPTIGSPHPGRMSPNASIAFLSIGLALHSYCRPSQFGRRWLYPALNVVVACVGLAGLTGYMLGLESLFRLYSFNAILPSTAFGMAVSAAGLWMLLQEEVSEYTASSTDNERSIGYRSLVVLALVALGAGVAGFSVLRETFEQTVSQSMLLSATTNAKSLANTIELNMWFPRTASTRIPIRNAFQKLRTHPDDLEAKDSLHKIAESFLLTGITGLEFFDARGGLAASAGRIDLPVARTQHHLTISGLSAIVAWNNGYFLSTDVNVIVDGQVVGRVVAEQPLKLFDELLSEVRGGNDTADAALFSREGDRVLFGPTRFHPTAFDVAMFDAAGQPSQPVVRALLGQRGVAFDKDLRGARVISAYAPVGAYGLAFGVNADVANLYAPLKSRLALLAMTIGGIIALGLYAQRTQVRPLLRQLVASKNRINAILEEQSELVSLAKPDGELTYVNPAYANHFGSRPEDMIGSNLFDQIEFADREKVRETIDAVFRTGSTTASENRMVMKNGVERWVAWTNAVQIDARGARLLHSVGRDVTERKHAELALLSSRALLARTGRVAGVGGWELNLRSGVVTWSEETCRIHEVPNDFVPKLETAVQFYAPESRPVIEAAVQAAIAKGTPWDLELGIVTATGRSIWVRAQGEAEFEGQSPIRLVGALQDITERKRLQRKLADNEQFIRKITDSQPIRIAYLDPELRYRFVNLTHCKDFELDREAIIGRTHSELTGGVADAVLLPKLGAALQGQEQCFEFDEVVDGKVRRFESRLIPDFADSGSVQGLFTTGIDITDRSLAERALRELTVIFDNTTDFVVQTDFRGKLTYLNPAVRQATGIELNEAVVGRSYNDFNTAETQRLYADVILPAVHENGVWVGETTVLLAHRRVAAVSHMVIAHRDAFGRVARYSAIMRDISAEVAAKSEAERQTATLRSVSEAIPAVVAVVGRDLRYRFVNSAFEHWIGLTREAIVGKTLEEILGVDDYERTRPWLERVAAGESVAFQRDYADARPIRHLSISYIPLRLDSGEVDGFVGVAQDITQHKREEVRLLQLSQTDALTGLMNRAGFEQYLDRHTATSVGDITGTLALLYIDLDHFKPVNDEHGHPVGDQLLQLFSNRLLRIVRPTDAVARLGGDEFAIALAGIGDLDNASAVAEKVLSAASTPFNIDALVLNVGASVGVAFESKPKSNWRNLIKLADQQLYEAKAAGRGRFSARDSDQPA